MAGARGAQTHFKASLSSRTTPRPDVRLPVQQHALGIARAATAHQPTAPFVLGHEMTLDEHGEHERA
jgi:hypothetical protein